MAGTHPLARKRMSLMQSSVDLDGQLQDVAAGWIFNPHAGHPHRGVRQRCADVQSDPVFEQNTSSLMQSYRFITARARPSTTALRIIRPIMASDFTPQRVVCLQPSATLTMRDIGLLDRVVACTKYCADVCPEVADGNRRIVSDSWTAQTEEIRAAKPDLIIASVPYQAEAVGEVLKGGVRFLGFAPTNTGRYLWRHCGGGWSHGRARSRRRSHTRHASGNRRNSCRSAFTTRRSLACSAKSGASH